MPNLPDPEKERLEILKAFGFQIDTSSTTPALPPVPSAPAAPDAPAVPAPTATPSPAASATPTPPATPTPAAPAAPREPKRLPTPAEIAEKAIKEAAERLAGKPAEVPAEPAAEPEDPELKTRLSALKLLQEDPKYASRDIEKEYTGYLGKLSDYEKEWTKAHPKEEFDLDSSEHDSWREKHEPEIAEDDIRAAEIEVKTLRRIEEREARKNEDVFAGQLVSQAGSDAASAVVEMLQFAGPGPDGKPVTDLDTLDKTDWVAAVVAQNYVPQAAALSATITTLLTPGSPVKYDATKAEHREIARQVQHYETEILKLPGNQRLDGQGRLYATEAEYVRLPATERAKRWTFRYSPTEMRALVLNDIRTTMKEHYDRVKARSATPAVAPQSGTPPVTGVVAGQSPPVRPPSGGSGPGSVPTSTTPSTTRKISFWE
jgi:hypothetical protein